MNIGGLGSLAGGLAQGYLTGEQIEQKRREQQLALQGQDIAGQALIGSTGPQVGLPGPGAMPGSAPSPGQPSVPMQSPLPGAQPMPGAQPQQGQQQPTPQAQAPQQGQQQFDLPTLVSVIRQKNPQITGPQMMSAIQALLPSLNAQGLMQYRQAMIQLSQQRANTGDLNAETNRQRMEAEVVAKQQRAQQAQENFQLALRKADDANLRFEQNRNDTQAYRAKVLADRDVEDAQKLLTGLGQAVPGSVDPMAARTMATDAQQKLQQPRDPYKVPPRLAPSAPTHVQTETITPPAQSGPTPQDLQATIANAKAAIAAGRDPAGIRAKLQQNGIDPKLLDQ